MTSYALMNRVGFEPCRGIAGSSITSSYQAVPALNGTSPTATAFPSRVVFFQNQTNGTVVFSIDKVNIAFVLPPGSFFLVDETSNSTPQGPYFLGQNTTFYVENNSTYGTVPSSGYVFITNQYGAGPSI
jgi:hypothetical protein